MIILFGQNLTLFLMRGGLGIFSIYLAYAYNNLQHIHFLTFLHQIVLFGKPQFGVL